MLTSTSLIDPIAKEVLGLGPDQWPESVLIDVAPAGESAVKLTTTVLPREAGARGNARALLEAIVQRAQHSIDQLAVAGLEEANLRLEQLREEQTRLEKHMADMRSERAALEQAVRGVANERQPRVEAGRVPLELDIAERKARIHELERAVNEQRTQQEQHAKALRKLLEDRRMLVEQLQSEATKGRDVSLELARARVELAETELRLVEIAVPTANSLLGSLSSQLTSQRVELAALVQRLERLAGPPTTQPRSPEELSGELMRVQSREQSLHIELSRVQNEIERLRREIASRPGALRLVVLGWAEPPRPK